MVHKQVNQALLQTINHHQYYLVHNTLLSTDISVRTLAFPQQPTIEESGNVTAAVGTTAVLNCRVRNVGNKTVSVVGFVGGYVGVRRECGCQDEGMGVGFELVLLKVYELQLVLKS